MEGFIQTFESLSKTRKLNPFSILLLGQDSSYLSLKSSINLLLLLRSNQSIRPSGVSSLPAFRLDCQIFHGPVSRCTLEILECRPCCDISQHSAFPFSSPYCYSLDRMHSLQVTHLPKAWFSPGMGLWLEEVG